MKTAKTTSTDPEAPLTEALRTQLLTILKKPLSASTLLELEQTARLARELLAVGKNPEAFRKQKKSSMYESNSLFGSNPLIDDGAGGIISQPIETFGANAVRELVAALPALIPKPPAPEQPSMTQQIMGIAYARERGLIDLAQQLENKMLGICAGEMRAADHPLLAEIREEMHKETVKKLNGKTKATS